MKMKSNWLKEQRVSGGYSYATAMLLTNCDAETYVNFFIDRMNKKQNLQLELKIANEQYEITEQDQIVWFGRSIDVDLLRTVRIGLFEEIMVGRIKTLRSVGAITR